MKLALYLPIYRGICSGSLMCTFTHPLLTQGHLLLLSQHGANMSETASPSRKPQYWEAAGGGGVGVVFDQDTNSQNLRSVLRTQRECPANALSKCYGIRSGRRRLRKTSWPEGRSPSEGAQEMELNRH